MKFSADLAIKPDFYRDNWSQFDAHSDEKELFHRVADQCVYKCFEHPDWLILAGRIKMEELKCLACKTFSEVAKELPKWFNNSCRDFIITNSKELDKMIVPSRDYQYNFLAMKTMIRSYLIKYDDDHVLETAQYMWMRTAIQLHHPDLELIKETYEDLSTHQYSHASPTLFNSCARRNGLSSCFLVDIPDDMVGIADAMKVTALISMNGGGLGFSVSNIRHSGIGALGKSSGTTKMLKVFDALLQYVDQGGKRNGSATFFMEPWHKDIMSFIDLRRPTGGEDQRARNNTYAVWVPDIFMERVENDGDWSLFCPNLSRRTSDGKSLHEMYGDEFDQYYCWLENHADSSGKMKARVLWEAICESQRVTGVPFILYKDQVNHSNMEDFLGIIKSSNLCCEIVEYTDKDFISICNLAALSLPACVSTINGKNPIFNYGKLEKNVRKVVRNLNQVIDRSFVHKVLDKIKKDNMDYRPMGIGLSGWADTVAMMDWAPESQETKEWNRNIAETIYYAAITESCEMARETTPFKDWENSNYAKGLLHFDLWNQNRIRVGKKNEIFISSRYDWDNVKQKVKQYGVKNVLLHALMPTASSAMILGNNECFEPFTSNLYVRNLLSGEHIIFNKHLVKDCEKLGIWTKSLRNFLMQNKGSIQGYTINKKEFTNWNPAKTDQLDYLKLKYKTVFELSPSLLIDLAADRQPLIDQAQSLNCFMANPDYNSQTAWHFYGYNKGLKTGMYYLRSLPAVEAKNMAQRAVERTQDLDENDLQKSNTLVLKDQNGLTENDEEIENMEQLIREASMVCTEEICTSCQS